MSGPIASLFSSIDSAKRKVADALANPGASFEQFVDHRNNQAGEQLSLLKDSGPPVGKQTPEQRAARQKLAEAMAEGMNPAGILAGPMAKTANFDKLRKAVQMEMKKAHPEEIWQETGWTRGLDRRWRFEIPDQFTQPVGLEREIARPAGLGARSYERLSTPPPRQLGDFDKIYDHPELYEAYPQLKQIAGRLSLDPQLSKPYAGSYSYGPGNGPGTLLAQGTTYDYLKDTTLHELQHAVQGLEKFAGGGSPQQFLSQSGGDPLKAHALYERLKGEAEARLVSGRSWLKPETLKNVSPFQPEAFKTLTRVRPEETFTVMPNPYAQP
jgi:hypothetical protein